jgi:hypothetical protein
MMALRDGLMNCEGIIDIIPLKGEDMKKWSAKTRAVISPARLPPITIAQFPKLSMNPALLSVRIRRDAHGDVTTFFYHILRPQN